MILRRNRRLRTTQAIRSLVRETSIAPTDFIVPVFIVEGKGIKQEIPSMPNYYRYSLDLMQKEILELWAMGLKSVLLFVKVAEQLKDNKGTEALNAQGLMQRAIKTIKEVCPEMLVMTDVALDPYSKYGHDGIVEHGIIQNDATNSVLAEMALSHAQAGADIIAPSDMMDGRIFDIRSLLEQEGFHNTGIMSYSAKYASAFTALLEMLCKAHLLLLKTSPKTNKPTKWILQTGKRLLKKPLWMLKKGQTL